MSANSTKSIYFALGANSSIAVAKSFAAWITGSGAMLAEAIHSFADSGNQLLLLLGLKQAGKPSDESHPLGYGKSTYFWSFIVALILFSMGGMFSLYEGIHKLQHPTELVKPEWAIGVLIFAIIAEGISMWGALREIRKVQYGRPLWRWFRESRQSELIVVFGEDLAALVGLVLALAAIVATIITGNPAWDAMGTIAIGVLLLLIAIAIGVEVKELLIGESADPVIKKEMLHFLHQQEAVAEVYNLITLQMGGDIMVAVKARMSGTNEADTMIENINQIERSFRSRFREVKWLFFEPDNRD
ncbi:MAG: cation diffusion facilitator family transporter [Proteobacteria bacterium]|nr:cation diffusion facilitator family transporter [Pseudomonadota bacterium]